nr:patatin-like phospholipase family protein [Alkaliphilus hydrothermalis]
MGLTLEGGGAKGSYQIGAWKAFKELGIDFDGISGTSVGALNGAMMLQEDFDLAHELWYNMTPTTIMDIDERIYEMFGESEVSSGSLGVIYEEVKRIIKGQGIDPKPLRHLVRQYVNEEVIRKSPKHFGFVTVCLTDRKPLEIYKEDVPDGKMADYLVASSYLPIFKSKKLDGKVFLDGGFYNNLPIEMLYKKGCKKVIAVRLLSKGRVKKVEYEDLEITYISPNQPLGGIMAFTKDLARHNMTLGYFDTLRVFKNLNGSTYYIQDRIQDSVALKFFMGLGEECINKLGSLFNLTTTLPANRLMVEEVIPKLIALMGLDKNATYGEVLTSIIENMAAYHNIEPFKIYDTETLLEEITYIKSCSNEEKGVEMGNYIIKDLLLRLDKEKLLKEAIRIILMSNQKLVIYN